MALSMNTRLVALTFALAAAACNRSETTSQESVTRTTGGEFGRADAASAPNGATLANDPGSVDQTHRADNTGVNERDLHGGLTPTDQGNGAAETKISGDIRKGLMADKTLSFTAKNVKVITVGSKVTLRGPVNTDQEKASIAALAKQTPGVTEVDDQLEVKK